jgi:hypothetical protein
MPIYGGDQEARRVGTDVDCGNVILGYWNILG